MPFTCWVKLEGLLIGPLFLPLVFWVKLEGLLIGPLFLPLVFDERNFATMRKIQMISAITTSDLIRIPLVRTIAGKGNESNT